jgi:hypothetical protein
MKWFRVGIFYLAIMGVSHLVGHIAIFYSRMFHIPTNTDTLIIGRAALTDIQLLKGFSLWYSLFFLWLFGLSLALYSQRRIIPLHLFRQVSFIHIAMLASGTMISAYFFFWFPAVCAAMGMVLFCW